MEELVQAFSIERIGKSGSKFDLEKAKWFNHQYLINKSSMFLAEQLMPVMVEKGVLAEAGQLAKAVDLVKDRATFITDFWEQLDYIFIRPESYDAKAVKKRWKAASYDQMNELKTLLASLDDFSPANTEAVVKRWIEEKEYGMGAVMNAFRLLIVGALKGPHLFDILALIGQEETLERLDTGLHELGKKES